MTGYHVRAASEHTFLEIVQEVVGLTQYGKCRRCQLPPVLAIKCVPDGRVSAWVLYQVGNTWLTKTAELRADRPPMLVEHPLTCRCEPRVVAVPYRLPCGIQLVARRAGPRLAEQLRNL